MQAREREMEDLEEEENGAEEVLGSSLTMEKVAAAKKFIENHNRFNFGLFIFMEPVLLFQFMFCFLMQMVEPILKAALYPSATCIV